MIPAEWIRPGERVLTAEQVKRLEPGTRVYIISKDRYGEKTEMACKVVCSYKTRLLEYVDPATWEKSVMKIADKENRKYIIRKEASSC